MSIESNPDKSFAGSEREQFREHFPDYAQQMRILRSFEISVILRSDEVFEVRNLNNGHTYRLQLSGSKAVCQCPDSLKGNHCKHAHAVERAIEFFDASFDLPEADE